MKVAVFHGSPRRGNTYIAAEILLDELQSNGNVGEGAYPYKYWQEKGYFNRRPF